MTRRDFVLIAAALANARIGLDPNSVLHLGVNRAMFELAGALAQTNPRFDRARFYEAAGLNPATLLSERTPS